MKLRDRPIVKRLRAVLKRIHARCKSCWARLNRHLGKMWVRLLALVFAALGGFILGKVGSPWFLGLFPEEIYGDARTVISAIPFTLPTFLALWWFRTYDSFQSNLRATFDSGVAHIASDTPDRIEIGTVMLINISETTSLYDREISIAFIRRLKQSPAATEAIHELLNTFTYRSYNRSWSYAYKMLQWLKNQNKKYDLRYVDLRNQDCPVSESMVTVCDLLNMEKESELTIEVACTSVRFVSAIFCCCRSAGERLREAEEYNQKKYQAQREAAREAGLEAYTEHEDISPDMDARTSLPVTVSRHDCGKKPK